MDTGNLRFDFHVLRKRAENCIRTLDLDKCPVNVFRDLRKVIVCCKAYDTLEMHGCSAGTADSLETFSEYVRTASEYVFPQ